MEDVIEDWRLHHRLVIDDDRSREEQCEAKINAGLWVRQHRPDPPLQQQHGQQAEWQAGNEHEDRRHIGRIGIVEIAKRGIMRGIAPGRHRRHGVRDGIKPVHAGQVIQQRAQH